MPLRGLIVFPSQVEEALLRFPEAGANFRMYIGTDSRGMDSFRLRVEVKDAELLKNDDRMAELGAAMRRAVRNVTNVNPNGVDLVAPDSLPRVTAGEGKTATARVEDSRKKE